MRSSILVTTLSAALVACSGGSNPGDPCSAKQSCGDGLVCDLTSPTGPICLDGSGDEDGDGITNDKDHCQHMAGGAFDEDGDGIGDECDACPIAKPPDVAETDGDGVDSPCDPNPTMPGDKIVLFNGFNEPLPSKWTASAAWKVVGGEAIMTPTNPAAIELLSVNVPGTTHMAIFSSYRIDSVAPGANSADAAVSGANRLPAGTTTVVCGGSRSGGTDQLLLTTDAGQGFKSFSNLFDPASLYRVAEQIDGANANCALIANTSNGAVQTAVSVNAMTEAGLYARGATARFSYLLVVTR